MRLELRLALIQEGTYTFGKARRVQQLTLAFSLVGQQVGVDGRLEHVRLAVDLALAFGQRRALAGRREERAEGGAGGLF